MTPIQETQRSPLDEVRQLRLLLDEVTVGLRNQQDLLRVRKIELPREALEGVVALQSNVSRLETTLSDLQRERTQLQALVVTSAILNSSLDLDAVLLDAMNEIINLTGAERGYILLKNWVTGEVEFRLARDLDQITPSPMSGSYQVSHTILNEVLTTGEPLLTDNAFKDPRMQNSQTVNHFVLRSVLCVPLRYKDDIIGVVYVDNRFRIAVFTERELTLLSAFANQIAVAVENARLYASLQSTLAEITEMKELIENVFASIGSGVVTTDGSDTITMYNHAAASIFAQQPGAAIGQPLKAVLPTINPEFEALLHRVREENQTAALEAAPDVPGRGRVVLNLKMSPLKDAGDQTQGVAMIMDDLTAEREREETLNVLRRYLPPGMVENIHHIAGIALGGERREVTCLFADVCPLSTFPPDLRPEQIMELLNVYLSQATEAVHDAEGLIDKYMGSEMMVLFNTQLNPQDDHAARAVRTALDLRERLNEIYRLLEMGVDSRFYRIGIHSGVATLGNVGSLSRRSFTALGDTINLAKRLQENAQGGQILASEDVLVYADTAGSQLYPIEFRELAAIQVKGRRQQTPVYEVVYG